MRVVAPDTGGGFGQKNGLYPEYVLCLEAARRLGRPVKWTPERSETLSAGCHARDNVFSVSAAVDAAGRITAIDAVRRMNMGAYSSSRGMVPVQNGLTHLTGVYGVKAAHVRVEGVLTNTAPTCSYRGAGRPENVYACERLVDMIARRIGQDSYRVPPHQSGEANADALDLSAWDPLRAARFRRAARRRLKMHRSRRLRSTPHAIGKVGPPPRLRHLLVRRGSSRLT